MILKSEKKVLFIHHGAHDGGAPLSMLYTMQGLKKAGYTCTAGLRSPSKELNTLYNKAGFATIDMPWIPKLITWSGSEGKTLNPYIWFTLAHAALVWKYAQNKTIGLLRKHQFNIVHLNSVALSNPAQILNQHNIPYIWHVRENAPSRKGKRYQFIKKNLLNAKEVIFLSKAEQEAWTGETKHGTVVSNFIDFKKFNEIKDSIELRQKLNIKPNQKIILYVGGLRSHKGIIPLLQALSYVRKKKVSDFVCLMPDTILKESIKPNRFQKQVFYLINNLNLRKNIRRLPFNPDIRDLFAVCDTLVFPATKSHFARPIIEASAMKKPSIASNLPVLDELIIDEKTGLLAKVNDPIDLSEKLISLITNPEKSKKLGEEAFNFAFQNFEQEKQMQKIISLYQNLA